MGSTVLVTALAPSVSASPGAQGNYGVCKLLAVRSAPSLHFSRVPIAGVPR